jgi:hypothetical protein
MIKRQNKKSNFICWSSLSGIRLEDSRRLIVIHAVRFFKLVGGCSVNPSKARSWTLGEDSFCT